MFGASSIEKMIRDILTFKGFLSSSLSDKAKWLFVLFPFFAGVVILYTVPYFFYSLKVKTSKRFKKKESKTTEK